MQELLPKHGDASLVLGRDSSRACSILAAPRIPSSALIRFLIALTGSQGPCIPGGRPRRSSMSWTESIRIFIMCGELLRGFSGRCECAETCHWPRSRHVLTANTRTASLHCQLVTYTRNGSSCATSSPLSDTMRNMAVHADAQLHQFVACRLYRPCIARWRSKVLCCALLLPSCIDG